MKISRRALVHGLTSAIAMSPAVTMGQSLPTLRLAGSSPVVRPDHALMFLGEPLGYNKALGFRSEYLPTQGSAAALQLVLSWAAEVANVALVELINMKARNRALPIRFYFALNGQSAYRIFVPHDSPVTSLQGLKGKIVGVPSLASGTVPFARALLRRAGMSANDVQFLPVGVGPQALAAMKGGRIDALCIFLPAIADMENKGERFREFTAPISGGGLVMADAFVKKSPDLATKVLQSTVLNQWVLFHEREAAVRAYWKQFGAPGGATDKSLLENAHLITRLCDTLHPWSSDTPRGEMTGDEWNEFARFYGGEGSLVPADLKMSDVYDGSLVQKSNMVDLSLARESVKVFK